MRYVEVVVRTTTSGADVVSMAMCDTGSGGTVIRDRADIDALASKQPSWTILDDSLRDDMDEDVLVTGYYPDDHRVSDRLAALRARLAQLKTMDLGGMDLGKATIKTATVEDDDWQNSWKKHYKPFRIGKLLVVKPTWERYAAKPGDIIIQLDPGMAFGTGAHETTALCAELIEEHMPPGSSVLDIGTGSGILAIAAMLLGGRRGLAIDLDAFAVKVARENIALNGLAERVVVAEGDLLTGVDGLYDVAISNIIADVVVLLSGQIDQALRPGGLWIASGIIRDRMRDVELAFEKAGINILETRVRGEWAAYAAIKP